MKVIGIETSGMTGSIALLKDETIKAEHRFIKGMVHGKYLVPVLKRALTKLRWKLKDIDLIAVDIGPGSYTGLRVGVATAKTMAYALQTNLVGVASLDVMAENIPPKYDFICPMIDARWNQIYTAIYKRNKVALLKSSLEPSFPHRRESSLTLDSCFRRNDITRRRNNIIVSTESNKVSSLTKHYSRTTDYLAIRPEEFKKRLPRNILLFGDGLIRYGDIFQRTDIKYGTKKQWVPLARQVAKLGLRAFQQGKRADYFSLVPLYLRPTEAEVTLRQKRGKRRLS